MATERRTAYFMLAAAMLQSMTNIDVIALEKTDPDTLLVDYVGHFSQWIFWYDVLSNTKSADDAAAAAGTNRTVVKFPTSTFGETTLTIPIAGFEAIKVPSLFSVLRAYIPLIRCNRPVPRDKAYDFRTWLESIYGNDPAARNFASALLRANSTKVGEFVDSMNRVMPQDGQLVLGGSDGATATYFGVYAADDSAPDNGIDAIASILWVGVPFYDVFSVKGRQILGRPAALASALDIDLQDFVSAGDTAPPGSSMADWSTVEAQVVSALSKLTQVTLEPFTVRLHRSYNDDASTNSAFTAIVQSTNVLCGDDTFDVADEAPQAPEAQQAPQAPEAQQAPQAPEAPQAPQADDDEFADFGFSP